MALYFFVLLLLFWLTFIRMDKMVRIAGKWLMVIAFMGLSVIGAKAQPVTGKWYGISETTRTAGYHLSSTEEKGDILQISGVDSGNLAGIGYHYYWFRGNFYYHVTNIAGAYDVKTKEWIIKEISIRNNHLFKAHYSCLRTYRLKYRTHKQIDSLTGNWSAASFDDCGAGTGRFARTMPALAKKGHIDSIEAMMHTVPPVPGSTGEQKQLSDELPRVANEGQSKQDPALQKMLARARTQTHEIVLQTPDIKVEVWDNNVIDGDNISLYFNNGLILNRKRLTAVPITVNIKAVSGKDNELIMYANNLGDIPPNTAMMRIYANGKQYDVFMSSDEHTSGMVKFVLP